MEPENFLDSFAKLDQVEDAQNFNVEFNTVIKDETSNLEYWVAAKIHEKWRNRQYAANNTYSYRCLLMFKLPMVRTCTIWITSLV